MNQLPERAALGQPLTDEDAATEAKRIIDNAILSFRDPTPLPVVGDTPPVAQPGRPPMSPKAVDDSVRMLSASVLIATTGGATTAILWASGYANPSVIALVFGAPTALALAIGRLLSRAKDVLPDEHHHHYTGPVHQQTVNSQTRLWGNTTNNL
jgi:hypothetical protein